MKITKTSFVLSVLVGSIMALVSAAGVFSDWVYAKEAYSWAVQGRAQDLVNLLLVFPLLLVATFKISKKKSSAWFGIWLGLIFYIAYSYVLYSFFMHFGILFLGYVAALGLSFFALISALLQIGKENFHLKLPKGIQKPTGVYLIASGSLFALLWLSEIVSSLMGGTGIASAESVGFWINPVHVLDLAFALPAMVAIGTMLIKDKEIGSAFVLPILVFMVAMGVAVIAMAVNMFAKGVADSLAPAVFMLVNISFASFFVYKILRKIK